MNNSIKGLVLCATALVTTALSGRATAAEFPTNEVNRAVAIYDEAQSWFAKSGAVQIVVKSQTFDGNGKLLVQYVQKDRWFVQLPNYRVEREFDSANERTINKKIGVYDGKMAATLNQNISKNGNPNSTPTLVSTKDQNNWVTGNQYFVLFGVTNLTSGTTIKELLPGMKDAPKWTVSAVEKNDLLSITMATPSVVETYSFRTKGDKGLVSFSRVLGQGKSVLRCDITEYKMVGAELRPTKMYVANRLYGRSEQYMDVTISEIAAADRPADPFHIEPQAGQFVIDRDNQ